MSRSPKGPARATAGYIGLLAACFLIGVVAAWTSFGAQIDNYAYDLLFRNIAAPEREPEAVVLAIDEAAFARFGGTRKLREILAASLEAIAPAPPKAVAIDILLSDAQEEAVDARVEAALASLRNPILPCDVVPSGWEDPLPRFARHAKALGHVHAEQNRMDGVARQIPLEAIAHGQRRWALALEAYRVTRSRPIVESPEDLDIGGTLVPAPRGPDGRLLRIRYLKQAFPTLAASDLIQNPRLASKLAGKVVFVGVTALSAARDRVVGPSGDAMPGVEVHAQAFETLAQERFLRPASNLSLVVTCLLIAAAAGLIFAFLEGWPAYLFAAVLMISAHMIPVVAFRESVVFPLLPPVSVAWLSVVGAAAYQYFVVQRQLRKSESDRKRYQQAIHFVTHEMRSPLTAIQGSSELMSRYNLNDDKRKQLATTINSESKRLARMIQTFLDVERLNEGEIELKKEPFALGDLTAACVERVRPLAERKQIAIQVKQPVQAPLLGDRELMEYAVYNLLTNAVKYSPAETRVTVFSDRKGDSVRLSVQDQGIGMDARELKNIFQKFYRTKRAEESGEVGTGIGLSIVEQIVASHGGRMEVASQPGAGSCFTMVLPCPAIPSPPEPSGADQVKR